MRCRVITPAGIRLRDQIADTGAGQRRLLIRLRTIVQPAESAGRLLLGHHQR